MSAKGQWGMTGFERLAAKRTFAPTVCGDAFGPERTFMSITANGSNEPILAVLCIAAYVFFCGSHLFSDSTDKGG